MLTKYSKDNECKYSGALWCADHQQQTVLNTLPSGWSQVKWRNTGKVEWPTAPGRWCRQTVPQSWHVDT